jgi:hypothetical protein
MGGLFSMGIDRIVLAADRTVLTGRPEEIYQKRVAAA